MRLGIIGLPTAGKTTIFNALTGSALPTGDFSGAGRVEVHTAVVDVPDPRLEALSERFRPPKTTHAKVTYADIGGLRAGAGREGLPGALLNQLTPMDGFVHVLRAFDDPQVPHPAGSVDPARDLAVMEAEFLLNDMLVVERRKARLREERGKGAREREALDREAELLQRLEECLGRQRPLRELELAADEERALAGFALLSRKPMLVVINLAEGAAAPGLAPVGRGVRVLGLQGKLEMEIAQLPPDEAGTYREEYGLTDAGSARVIEASYQLLGMKTFFTMNEDELRAWALPRNGTALAAAETIHTDLARGFIRAEVISWQELLELGGLAAARLQGRLRVEGKDYVVQDGDLITVRFHV